MKSSKKHILIISQYFYPEQFRINDISVEWIKRGYKVTVATGIPNYPQGEYFKGYGLFKKKKEIYNGVEIMRIPLLPRGHNSIMLVLNYLSFVISGWFWKSFTKIKADYVFIYEVSPMTQAFVGIWYAKKKSIPCYLYVQDLWPENVQIVTGLQNRHIIGTIGRMVDSIYARCTHIFTTSKSFRKSINSRGVPIEKITYWPQYAEDFYKPQAVKSISEINRDAFNVIFAGNIGNAQGLDVLPRAAKIIKGSNLDSRIQFNIIGDGRYKNDMIQLTETLGVSDMFNFIPKQPAEKIPEFLAASDVAFLSLTDDPLFSMTIPAKLQTYMACGMPIIASASGETDIIIKEANCGICCTPGNAEQLAQAIMDMTATSQDELAVMGRNARKYYDVNFDKKMLLDVMDKYFM